MATCRFHACVYRRRSFYRIFNALARFMINITCRISSDRDQLRWLWPLITWLPLPNLFLSIISVCISASGDCCSCLSLVRQSKKSLQLKPQWLRLNKKLSCCRDSARCGFRSLQCKSIRLQPTLTEFAYALLRYLLIYQYLCKQCFA